MTTLKLNKKEAAQRQIDLAIRLLFDNEDPVGIHTLAMAGFRILRDIAEKKDSDVSNLVQAIIKPGKEDKFWGSFHTFANFLKHANKDPEGIVDDIKEEINDPILLLASLYYRDLGYQFTPEMLTLTAWYSVIHPDAIEEDASDDFMRQVNLLQTTLLGKSRQEKLLEGKNVLALARAFLKK